MSDTPMAGRQASSEVLIEVFQDVAAALDRLVDDEQRAKVINAVRALFGIEVGNAGERKR